MCFVVQVANDVRTEKERMLPWKTASEVGPLLPATSLVPAMMCTNLAMCPGSQSRDLRERPRAVPAVVDVELGMALVRDREGLSGKLTQAALLQA